MQQNQENVSADSVACTAPGKDQLEAEIRATVNANRLAEVRATLEAYFAPLHLKQGKEWYIASVKPLVLRVPKEHAAMVSLLLYNTFQIESSRNVTLRTQTNLSE